VTSASDTIAGAFQQAATAAKSGEDAYRKTAAAEIARLVAERVTAFRRVRLIEILETAAVTVPDAAEASGAQRRRLCEELGWDGDSAAQAEVLDRLAPLCRAIADRVHQAHRGHADQPLMQELNDFERWFEASRKASFYALFDIYVQETPVVDF
jgi:hypothetical protein